MAQITFMREVRCASCGATTRLLLSTLARLIQLQAVSEDELSINFGCPQCMKLTRSDIVPGAKGFEGVDLSKFPDDIFLYAVSLQCAKTGCGSQVVLLEAVKRDVRQSELENYIKTNFENMSSVCSKGFPPSMHPQVVVGYERLN